jgi:hypothetical protein
MDGLHVIISVGAHFVVEPPAKLDVVAAGDARSRCVGK